MKHVRHREITLPRNLLNRCRYSRLQSRSGTVLMIDAGYFIQQECIRAFRQCGWQVILVPLDPPEQFIEKFLTSVIFHQPDLLFTVNHLGFDQNGAFTDLINAIELPFVSWFVDSPAYILLDHQKNATPLAITPIWEKSFIPFLEDFGFNHVWHLPLGGDPDVFNRIDNSFTDTYQVGFVGDSMEETVAKWKNLCFRFPKSAVLIEQSAKSLVQNRHRQPSDLIAETARGMGIRLPSMSVRSRLTLESTVVLEATRRYRHQAIRTLNTLPLHLFGDPGWEKVCPEDVQLHGSIDYYDELPAIYRATTVNLNFTSLQMATTTNQRVFDVPLAGGFIITDRQKELETLFDIGTEIVTFTVADEIPELVRYYSDHDLQRMEIVEAARNRILSEHTYRHRLTAIIDYARREFGEKNRRAVI